MDDDGWILNRSVCGKSIQNSTIWAYAIQIQTEKNIYVYTLNILAYARTYEIRAAFKRKTYSQWWFIFANADFGKMEKRKIWYIIMQKVHILPRPSLILLLIFIEIAKTRFIKKTVCISLLNDLDLVDIVGWMDCGSFNKTVRSVVQI